MSAATRAETVQPASVAANARALFALQMANYAIPVIILPFLIARLGTAAYGVMATAYATVMILVLLIDAGFNTLATREIARGRQDPSRVLQVYAATQWLRAAIAIVGSLTLVVLVYTVPALTENAAVYLATFMIVLGTFLFPTWLFQGLQIMHMTTICAVSGRIFVSVLIFLLIDSPDDLVLAAFLQASGTAVAGFVAQMTTIKRLGMRFFLPPAEVIPIVKNVLREVRFLTPSEFAMNVANNSTVFMLSLLASESLVGIYAAMEKIAKAVASGFQPIIRALYPYISERALQDRTSATRIARRWVLGTSLAVILAAVVMVVVARPVTDLLFGSEMSAFSWILQCLQVWIVCHIIVTAYGQLAVMALGQTRRFSQSLVLGAVVQIIATCVLAYYFSVTGLIAALVIGEVVKMLAYRFSSSLQESR